MPQWGTERNAHRDAGVVLVNIHLVRVDTRARVRIKIRVRTRVRLHSHRLAARAGDRGGIKPIIAS